MASTVDSGQNSGDKDGLWRRKDRATAATAVERTKNVQLQDATDMNIYQWYCAPTDSWL